MKALSRSLPLNQLFWLKIVRIPRLTHFGTFLLGFLLAKAVLLGELHPFGISFLAAVCVSHAGLRKAALAGVALGTCFIAGGFLLGAYLAGVLLLYFVLSHAKTTLHWYTAPSLVVAILLLVRGIGVFLTGNEIYNWIGILFESFFAGILTLVSITGLQACPRVIQGDTLSAEERTSLGLLMLGGLLGIDQAGLLGVGFQSILARLLVLCAALLGGPGGGAAVGVGVGLLPSIQGNLTTGPIAYYALAGLLGGVFNSFRKSGVVIGFTMANLLLSLFFSEQALIMQSLKETGLAIILFAILSFPQERNRPETENAALPKTDRLRTVGERLRKTGLIFTEIDKVFSVSKEKKPEKNELSGLFNKVASQVCEGCSLRRTCWEQDFYKTYRALMEACTKMEKNGIAHENDFGTDLKRRCIRLRELGMALNSQQELLKIIKLYEKQLESCHTLINTQLKGLTKIVEDLSREISLEEALSIDAERAVLQHLKDNGIQAEKVKVLALNTGEKEVVLTQSVCPDKNWCKSMVAPNVSQVLGKPYQLQEQNMCFHKGNGGCVYRLIPACALQINVGKAQCPKEGAAISGDVCASFHLPDHQYVLVMSDGMGTGKEACAESTAAIQLLEKMLAGGFSVHTAVKTINTVLFLRSGKECFATLDLIIINLVNGQAEFVKIGGAPSIIYSENGIKVVKANAPPVGILDMVDMQITRYYLGPDQLIIMMSDGVWEAIYSAGAPPDWIGKILKKTSLTDPQQIAAYLLLLAKKAYGNQAKDDMCVQVARID